MSDVWNESATIRKVANASPNKSLLLTYISALDLRLTQLLEKAFIPGEDSLLLSSKSSASLDLSQKIELGYRLGLISVNMKETLNALRNLRNKAAHTEEDIDFTDSSIEAKIDHIYSGLSIDTQSVFPAGSSKEKLEELCSLLIVDLATLRDIKMPFRPAEPEFAFTYIKSKPKKRKQ